MVLINQPSAAPTRKWTAATIAEVIAGLLSVAAVFGFDLGEDLDPEQIALGVAAVVALAGRVVAYFTKNRAA